VTDLHELIDRLTYLERAVEELRIENSRVPVREGKMSTGGTTLVRGRLVLTIPADGMLQDAVILEKWDVASNWFVDVDGVEIPGINHSNTPIRGSVAVPTAVWGNIVSATFQVGEPPVATKIDSLEIIRWEISSLEGHLTTTPDAEPQAPYHESGQNNYKVDGGPCEA
jgi:hypothetical protein